MNNPVFYLCKHIGIPTCTQHQLTRSVSRPEDDRLKRSKHAASYTLIKICNFA